MESTRKGTGGAVSGKPVHGLDELGLKDKPEMLKRIMAQDGKQWE